MGGEASLERRLVAHVLQPGEVWEIVNLGGKQIGTNTQAEIRGLDFRTSSVWGWGWGGGVRVTGCGGRSVSKVQRKFLKEIPFYAS